MNKSIVFDFIITTACSCMVIYLDKTKNLVGNDAFVYPFISATILFFLLKVIFLYVRKKSNYEGDWIEIVKKDGLKFYSIFTIEYMRKEDDYKIIGTSLDENGDVHATWVTLKSDINFAKDEIKYIYESKMTGHTVAEGYAHLYFNSRTGYFVDMGINLIRIEFNFFKVEKKLINEILGIKKNKIPRDLREDFVRKYHQKIHS